MKLDVGTRRRAANAKTHSRGVHLCHRYTITTYDRIKLPISTTSMAAAMEQHLRLAQGLHPRLLRFFTRWPPAQLSAATTTSPSQPETIHISSHTSSSDPNANTTTEITTIAPSSDQTNSNGKKSNPFLPFKNPQTGNWHGPHVSLRQQAELFKLAKEYYVLSLMPLSAKHPEVKEQKRMEHGLRIQGTGVGKKVKGKLWERTLRSRLEERRKAMEGMPEMIRHWKERGHGRGIKKWPK